MSDLTVVLVLLAFVAGVLAANWPTPWHRWRRPTRGAPPAEEPKTLHIPSLDYRQGYKDGLADSHRALGGGRRV